MRALRRIIGLALVAAVAALAVEAISSYVLYRHFSRLNRGFFPYGSATLALARDVLDKAEGRHSDDVVVTIDHGPLFRSDATLGFTLYPGRYRVTERRNGQSHIFRLTVDEWGRRVTAAVPSTASKRLFIAGDSAMFGWGLNDEETIPWLLQERFPNYRVVNLSLTSYSTVHSLLQLERANPQVAADDIVLVTYHLITNDFNVASEEMRGFLSNGFEHQLGDPRLVHDMVIPFGTVDAQGRLSVEHYPVGCGTPGSSASTCPKVTVGRGEADRVTELAFDAILAAQPGRVVIALLGGGDREPVVQYLKSKGVAIIDSQLAPGAPDATDQVVTDGHSGPFWHYDVAELLGSALQQSGMLK